MNIKLRKIEIYDRPSEETLAFCAEVWINGIHAAEASNSGKGEAIRVTPIGPGSIKLIREAEKWCEDQPPFVIDPTKYGIHEGGEPLPVFEVPCNLDSYLDNLILQHLEKTVQENNN